MLTRWFLLVLAASVALTACKDEEVIVDPGGPPAPAFGFPEAVGLIMSQKCTDCHGSAAADAGLRLDSWAEMIKGSDFGEAVIPYDAENSTLIEMVTKLLPVRHPAEVLAAIGDGSVHEDDTLTTGEVTTLTDWVNGGATSDEGVVPYENSTNRVIVAAQAEGIVSIIDADALVVIRNIKLADLGFASGSSPHHAAVAADGQSFYVSLIGANRVLHFDSNYQKIGESPDIAIPALLAVHPDPMVNKVYVSRFMDFNNIQNTVFAMDGSSLQGAPGVIPVGFPIPHCMAITHSGDYMFTSSLSQNQFIVVTTATSSADYFLPLGSGKGPLQATVSPDDQEVYLSCQLSNQMLVIDVSDPTNPVVADSIDVAALPWHPAFSADGSRVYVGNNGANAVTVINTATRTIEATIIGNGLSQPHGIAVATNEPYVFVSSRNVNGGYVPRHDFGDNANAGTVVVIDTATNQIIKVLEIENFGSGMAYWAQ